MRSILSFGAAAALLVAAACGSASAPPAGEVPTIVATTSVWADVVANLVCDSPAIVEELVPPGADPHGFEPSLADRGQMEAAALVVTNGLGLEEGLDDTIDAIEDAGTPVVRMGELIDPLAGQESDDRDPHVWFDPSRVSAALPVLAAEIVETTGLPPAAVDVCLSDYQRELSGVDTEIRDLLASIDDPDRKLVTNHDALGYFAERYGFEVIGTVIPAASGLAETSPAELEELASLVIEADVPAIFVEDQHATADAEALADRIGDIAVVTLFTGSLGDAESGADTYVGLLRTDAQRIAAALG